MLVKQEFRSTLTAESQGEATSHFHSQRYNFVRKVFRKQTAAAESLLMWNS